MSSWGWRRADPWADTGDAACWNSGTAPEPPLSCPGQARTADLSRIYLPPLTSGTNSGLDDHGCTLEGLKEAGRGTEKRDRPWGPTPCPFTSSPGHWGRPPGCRLALGQRRGALEGSFAAGALEGRVERGRTPSSGVGRVVGHPSACRRRPPSLPVLEPFLLRQGPTWWQILSLTEGRPGRSHTTQENTISTPDLGLQRPA